MLRGTWVLAFVVLGLVLITQGCAATSVERMVGEHDHAGLATYYAKQAQELREAATKWEAAAAYYEKHPEPHGKIEPAQHAAHCRAIAQNHRKAADEADALAADHRAMRP